MTSPLVETPSFPWLNSSSDGNNTSPVPFQRHSLRVHELRLSPTLRQAFLALCFATAIAGQRAKLMIENNWKNFLKNLGEWQGSFTSVSLEGELLNSTPSILSLEGREDNKLVLFRLRRLRFVELYDRL